MSESPRRERKVISAVFVDLVGFTARSEMLDPEDVEAFLRPYHAQLRAHFERFGGTVEKFIGDAVVAVFGAPVAHEDDPERAVRAALAIRDAIRDAGELEVRIGINTGEAIVRLDLESGSGEGFAAGDVINTAARLQAGAPVNGILVGDGTYQATRDAIVYEPVEAVTAKGKAEPIPAWSAVEARARFGVDVSQSSAIPLVGRDRERSLLVDTLERAESEASPQLVTIVGVPGIGKSRLVYELFLHVDARPELRTWRQGRSLSYGEGISYWALAEMVKAEAGILEGDEPAVAADKLATAVGEVVPESEAAWVLRWLGPLVGIGAERDEGRDRREETFAAWRRFLEALAERRTLVLVFEDLHWADDGLLDFIDHLADWATGVPLLVVGTARPELLERRPNWGGGKRNALTLALSPLSREDAGRVLEAVLAGTEVSAGAIGDLLERASGNPLYAQQFARLLLERGSLDGLALPGSIHGLIAARLDGLSVEEKAVLQDAAVMGKVFWTGALGREPSPALLQGLQRKEFIRRERRASVATEEEFSFCHVLVRDVAYSQIPRAERAAKHRRAAAWIESLGRPQDHAELLAHHYAAALELTPGVADDQLVERVRRAWSEAGDRALGLHATLQARDAYERALDLTPAGDRERARLLARLAEAEHRLTGDAVERFREAIAALDASDEPVATAAVEALLVRNLWELGRTGEADAHLDHAVDLVQGTPPSPTKALVLATRAHYSHLAGRGEQSRARAAEALAMATDLGLEELRAQLLNTIALTRQAAGEPGAIEMMRESVAIHEALNSPDAHRSWNNLGFMLYLEGRIAENEAADVEAARAAARFGKANHVRWSAHVQTGWPFLHGDWDEALRQIDPLIEQSEAGTRNYLTSTVRLIRARIRVDRGDLAGALADLELATEQDRRLQEPQALFPALGIGGRIRLDAGDRRGAEVAVDELIARRRSLAGPFPFGADAEVVDGIVRLGRAEAFLASAEIRRRTPWLEAAERIVAGDWAGATAVYERIGDPRSAALARLRWAQALAAAGDGPRALQEVHPAVAYYRRARATARLAQIEATVGLPLG